MQSFVGALSSGLSRRGHEVRVLSARALLGRFGSRTGLGKWLAYVDKYVFFPPELRRACRWADVVHVRDQGNAIYMGFLQDVPHLLTCHDLLAIRGSLGEITDWSTGVTGRIYQGLILRGLRRASNVVCDSVATRQDVLRLTKIAPGAVRLVYVGLLQSYRPRPTAEAAVHLEGLGITSAPYLLHIGSNAPYKNRTAVLKIYRALRHEGDGARYQLVMAGQPFTEQMRTYVEAHELAGHVSERTDITHDQLQALYSQAAGLIFPSLYEGFGLPIIEAQASGCPVFTSDRAPMTEVGGGAAAYFDPDDAEGAARVITERLEEREQMVQAGFEDVRRFDPELMLDNYLAVYGDIVRGSLQALP